MQLALPDSLLIVGRADHRHHNTQQDAQQQCHDSDHQCDAHALQILLPTVSFDKGLIELDKGLLPEGQCFAGLHHLFPGKIVLCQIHGHPLSFSLYSENTPKKAALGRPFRSVWDYSAVM